MKLMEGSEAMAEASIAAGCTFFAGYPMTPFTELLEHFAKRLPEEGGVCINAESELEAVGMAWGALVDRRPRRDRLDRPGPLAHAGVVLRDHARRAPARDLQHGPRPAGLLPVHPRRRARRLPPHRARADGHRRGRRAHPARVPPRRQVAQPRPRLRRLPDRAHPGGGRHRAGRRSTTAARRRTGRSTARSAAAAGRGSSRRSASARRASRRRASSSTCARSPAKFAAIEATEVRVETGCTEDAETVIVAFGSPGKFVRYVVAAAAGRGREDRLRPPDHALAVPVRSGRRRGRRRASASACSSCARAR